GRAYLSKIFSDEWMAANGFLDKAGVAAKLSDVIEHKGGILPAIVHTHPETSLRETISFFSKYSVSQMPVVDDDPVERREQVVGSVDERKLLDAVYQNPGVLDRPVSDSMDEPFEFVDVR